jgi:hypothetical protein
MGVCISFYWLGRYYNDTQYTNIAEKLIEEIFEQVSTVNSTDIENGLSGIAFLYKKAITAK